MFKASCNYSQLNNYNSSAAAQNYNTAMMSVPSATGKANEAQGNYVVPSWSKITYGTLMHNAEPGCAGYFNITNAYPGSENCVTNYEYSKCNSQ